jgi:hypothetical protein
VSDETKVVVKSGDMGGLAGMLWLAGWMFTIGYLGLHMPKALFALLIWPYFLGVAFR